MTIKDLYTKYFHDLYRFVFSLTKDKHLTEDIVQETFIRAYLNLGNINQTTNKAWLFTVARHLFYDHLRKNKKITDIDYDFSRIKDRQKTPEERLFTKEVIKQLLKRIKNLQDNYRKAIIYFYIEEMSYKEAATAMNVTVANFKSILFRARNKLRQLSKER